ncbi:MAG: hypothetical protein JWO62_589 [Acidimicrobiaceae bacterium]|nr:hypothetical protein [Acidimicrobiaceae bacterium]
MKGDEPPKQERGEWHHNRRHIDSNRILRETAMSLQTTVTGLDLVQPDELDVLEKLEWVASIREWNAAALDPRPARATSRQPDQSRQYWHP